MNKPESTREKPLRLWPGIAGTILVVVGRFLIAPFVPGGGVIGLLIGMSGAAVVLLWWLFFSRAPWLDRVGALVLIPLAAVVTRRLVDPSIDGPGGGLLFMVLLPATVPPFLVAGATLARRSRLGARWITMAMAIFLGCAIWSLARAEGMEGGARLRFAWRWTPTAEERLLATNDAPAPAAPTAATVAPADPSPTTPEKPAVAAPALTPILWSGFRGRERSAVIEGLRIKTDWGVSPPTQVWRRRIGPGWSSFAVAGDLIFTHEQRGEHEVVSAYGLNTGEPVWRHQDPARFYEPAAGAGPRATPAVHEGRVYAMGATGIVSALDARTGARIWTRDVESDTGAARPDWGFAASPVIVGDLVVMAASGRLVAYELATGNLRWTTRTSAGGYSSPHPATVAGVPQILMQNGGGITSVGLDGKILWENYGEDGMAIVQPHVLDDGSVLSATAVALRGLGVRRLAVAHDADGSWKVEERWMSTGLKPYFSDFVVHKGHAYGFDGTILSAINLETGERVWKGGRYGAGQMLLLSAQDLLLIVSEEGDLAVVAASPEKYTELAKFKAIEGKTWNHPVLVKDLLLVRNGEEMAAFRLPK